MTFKLSHKAQKDLIEIWEYTFQNWSQNQADRYYKGIFDKINEICKKPFAGKKYKLK